MSTPYQTPESATSLNHDSAIGESQRRKILLKWISPVKAGVVCAFVSALFTLIGMLLFIVFGLGSFLMADLRVSGSNLMGLGIGALIFAPLLYGLIGLIAGVIMAWIYNVVARITGGLECEVQDKLY